MVEPQSLAHVMSVVMPTVHPQRQNLVRVVKHARDVRDDFIIYMVRRYATDVKMNGCMPIDEYTMQYQCKFKGSSILLPFVCLCQ